MKLCFVITVNKLQGQLLNTIDIDFHSSAFIHSQLYVALLRITNINGLYILPSKNSDNMTDNIEYPKVLLL